MTPKGWLAKPVATGQRLQTPLRDVLAEAAAPDAESLPCEPDRPGVYKAALLTRGGRAAPSVQFEPSPEPGTWFFRNSACQIPGGDWLGDGSGFALAYPGGLVVIRGTHLLEVYEALAWHRVHKLRAFDPCHWATVDGRAVIESIAWEPLPEMGRE